MHPSYNALSHANTDDMEVTE